LQGVRVLALSEQLPVAQMSAFATKRLYDQAARSAAQGDIPQASVDAKRLAALDAATILRGIERDLAAARLELNRMLGLPPEMVLVLGTAEAVVQPPENAVLVDDAFDGRLDLQALRKGYDAAEADTRLAVILQFPNLSLNLTGARDTANNRTVGSQIAFTLPIWNRNRGGIAIANATRAQLHAEYDARLFQTRADIAAATSALRVLGRQRAELNAQLPALAHSADGARRAAAQGDIANAVAETAEQTLRDRTFARLQLDQAAAEQLIALELLSGGPRAAWFNAPAHEGKF
jgi:outer membrane protein TolC